MNQQNTTSQPTQMTQPPQIAAPAPQPKPVEQEIPYKQKLIWQRVMKRRELTLFQAEIRTAINNAKTTGVPYTPGQDTENKILQINFELGVLDSEIHKCNYREALADHDKLVYHQQSAPEEAPVATPEPEIPQSTTVYSTPKKPAPVNQAKAAHQATKMPDSPAPMHQKVEA